MPDRGAFLHWIEEHVDPQVAADGRERGALLAAALLRVFSAAARTDLVHKLAVLHADPRADNDTDRVVALFAEAGIYGARERAEIWLAALNEAGL